MSHTTTHFVPALGHDALTPFYDLVAGLLGDRRLKGRVIELAGIQPGHAVLDLGCGTATLALLVKEAIPTARVVGLDLDPQILARARKKVAASALEVELYQGSVTAPPFAPASFDRIVSTLVLHHLTTPQKQEALRAALRLLRPAGELHVADWGQPENWLMAIASLGFRLFDGAETTRANLRGELPGLISAAGFREVTEIEHQMSPLGSIRILRGRAPDPA